ncbi:hypothetical protein IV203_026267 [Nitzschia inconspicua]|uniref:Uncharacterized protein n=2 Tax=Nitzschia inconspicua TaxID=303405 RepID=A0A9K3PWZ8_9STRA|nr:hypothetical protein IV203_026267 [Nitzschia inconspicua]
MMPTFVSPTGLINSIPRSRPGSQRNNNNNNNIRTGDRSTPQPTSFSSHSTSQGGSKSSSSQSGAQHQRGAVNSAMPFYNKGNMLSAESFQKTYSNGTEPRVRRRSFEEAGHFGGPVDSLESPPSTSPIPSPPLLTPTLATSETIAPTSPVTSSSNPFMCASIPALSALTKPSQSTTAQFFTQRMSETSLACRQKYGPVASKAAGQAKAGMTEFAVMASEVYRQECRSTAGTKENYDGRGVDTDFFMETHNEDLADNSFFMEDNSLLFTEQRDTRNEVNISKNVPRNKSSPENQRPIVVSTPSTVGSSSSERLTPPPRVDRMLHPSQNFPPPFENNNNNHHKSLTTANDDLTDVDDESLRNARIRLFENHVAGIDNPEARLARALDDLNRQDIFIQSLKTQMQITQNTLDDTTKELSEVKTAAKEKQFKATEIRARSVQEKKRLEDLYQREVLQSKKLQQTISQLQAEVSTLKANLRNARSNKSPTGQDSGRNAQIISMKAELVELRSQLAEAHAINIDDSSSRNVVGDIDELRKRVQRDESELKDLRQRNQEGFQERQDLMERERLLQNKLESLQTSSQETQSRLEENLMTALKSADDVRAELVKTKANLQRLERERARARLHSSTDVERVQKELSKSREECAALKEELVNVRSISKKERRELTEEVEQLKEKLEKMQQENLAHSTETMREQRKLQDEVSCLVGEIRGLKDCLTGKDDEIASKAREIAELEEDIQTLKQGFHGGTETVSRLSRDLEVTQSKHAASSTEAILYKSLLDEARNNPTALQTQDFLKVLNDQTVQKLKAHVEKFYASTPNCDTKSLEASLKQEISSLKKNLPVSQPQAVSPAPKNEERLVAMEQAFLNEIAVLKAKLSESQTRIKEETFRSLEERRVNRESETERQAEIDKVYAERNEAVVARNALQLEVSALREKLSKLASDDVPDLIAESSSFGSCKSKENDALRVPNKVMRLRSELAQARERLAAARENSRSLPIRPSTSPGPNYEPSKWSRLTSNVLDAASKPKPATPTAASSTEGQPCVPRSTTRDSMNQGIDSVGPNMETPRISNGRSTNISLEELTRQLEASRKRLETADQRLNGLVSEGSLTTIVRTNPTDDSFDGSIDELVNNADGSIEVNHRRFADV